MDGHKGKDENRLVGSVSECAMAESVKQSDGSFGEGFEGEPCNGDDIMVEVLGSEVYVGGVCTSGSGENLDGDGEETDQGHGRCIDDAGVASERPENNRDGSTVPGLELRGTGVYGAEGSSQATEIHEGDLVAGQLVEENDRPSVVAVAMEVSEMDGITVEVPDKGNGAVAGSSGGETQVNQGVDVGLTTKEAFVGEETQLVEKSDDGLGDASQDVSKQEIEVLNKAATDPGIINGDGVSLPESQLVDEDAVLVKAELANGLASEAVEQDNKVVDDKADASTDSAKQKVGISEEAENPGFEKMVSISATVECSSAEAQVHEESSLVGNHELDLNPSVQLDGQGQVAGGGDGAVVDKEVVFSSTVSVMEIDVEEEKSSILVEKQEVKAEMGGDTAENHDVDSVSLHQPTQVVVEDEVTIKEVASVSEQDKNLEPEVYFDHSMACDITQVESNTGQEMELDTVNDAELVDFDGGQEGLLVSNTENPGTGDHLNAGDDTNEADVGGFPAVCAHTLQEVEGNKETVDVEQVDLHGGQIVESEKQQMTPDEMGGRTEKDGQVDEVVTSLDQPTQIVDAEYAIPCESLPNSVNQDVLPLPLAKSEKSQLETLGGATETEGQVNDDLDVSQMDTDEAFVSEIKVQEHSDTYQRLSNEEFLDQDITTGSGVSQRNIAEEEADHKELVTAPNDIGLLGEQDLVVVKEVSEDDQPNSSEQKVVNCESLDAESSSQMQEPNYELLPEREGVFSVPDLVWGKVKSHPWWPGQIFDFTDASEKAMKHHKKDCFLVAYFGDRTFAWNEASTLKSFQTHFSEMVAHCNGETFQNAVSCALEEVSRRIELGLACSCIPKTSYDNIRLQIVENAGIRPESRRRDGVDESSGVSFLRTDKLMEYVKTLAQSPSGGSDHLGLTIAKAQLLAFGRFRGYGSLPEFQFCGELAESDTVGPRFHDVRLGDEFEHGNPLSKDDEQASSSREVPKVPRSSHKRKHNLRDTPYPKIKEKSMSELMGSSLDYPDEDNLSGKRRKSSDAHADDSTTQDGRKTISLSKISNSTPPKQSFKIGDCMRRVASQLTGSPSTKGVGERVQKPDGSSQGLGDEYEIFLQSSEGKSTDPTEYSSLDELLFQLQFIAQDPLKEYSFSNVIINFFSDFRNSVIGDNQYPGNQLVAVEKVGGKRKKGSPETFEFDDMNDTYWTDRVIQNGAEEQPPRRNKKKDNQTAPVQPEKTPKEGRRPYNRKRYSNGDHTVTPQKPPGYISENAPTELIMNFSEVRSVPSESNLNKMFRRFGPLKETETEVDRESSRARVIFKKCSDAEVAFNSAGKFNIFGPTLVNYQLSYTPTLQFKPSPVVITQDHDMQLVLAAHDHELELDLSTHGHDMHLDLSAHEHDIQLDLSSLSEFEVNLVW